MSFIAQEIARQPASWRKAAELLSTISDALPQHGERVAVVGCGTSWFMAEAYAQLRESLGHGETDAFAASEFPHDRRYDRILAITRSGTTTEILDLLRRHGHQTTTTAITADTNTPIVEVSKRIISLDFADEQSIVQTLFATTALSLLRAHLGHDIAALSSAAELALTTPLPQSWRDAEQLTFLGTGWAHGIAREAALKMREASQAWTESYPTLEYRHGPISIAAPRRIVWQFGQGGDALDEQVRATGAQYIDHPQDAQVDLILIHRLAAARAEQQGLDPDQPRNLSRSVVLTN